MRGVTSNPTIFEKAIAGSGDYAELLQRAGRPGAGRQRALRAHRDPATSATPPTRCAASTSRPASATATSASRSRRSSRTTRRPRSARRGGCGAPVDRANLMIKVPATQQGHPGDSPADRRGHQRQRDAALLDRHLRARRAGLHRRARGPRGARRRARPVASVASFFVSRIDQPIDGLAHVAARTADRPGAGARAAADERQGRDRQRQARLPGVPGDLQRTTMAGARAARRADAAAAVGQHGHQEPGVQRRPLRRGADRPRHDHHACRRRRSTRSAITDGRAPASRRTSMRRATRWPRSPSRASSSRTSPITCSPKASTCSPARSASCSRRSTAQSKDAGAGRINRLTYALPPPLHAAVRQAHQRVGHGAQGTAAVGARRLALDRHGRRTVARLAGRRPRINRCERPAAAACRGAGEERPASRDVLLLGMGGSSLCPEVLKATFGKTAGFPELHVLDSTDPAQVKTFEHTVDLTHTLFVVSSKSGSTLEPNIFKEYFFDQLVQRVGRQHGGPPLRRHHRSGLDAAASRPSATASRASSSAGRRSADATRRSPISAWFPRR